MFKRMFSCQGGKINIFPRGMLVDNNFGSELELKIILVSSILGILIRTKCDYCLPLPVTHSNAFET